MDIIDGAARKKKAIYKKICLKILYFRKISMPKIGEK